MKKLLLSLLATLLFTTAAHATTLEDVKARGKLLCGVNPGLLGFARQVANRVIFMDQGQIIEQNSPAEFFSNPKSERTKLFLSQILH